MLQPELLFLMQFWLQEFIFDKSGLLKNEFFNLYRSLFRKYVDNPVQRTWQDLTFEQICVDHVAQIKKALGI